MFSQLFHQLGISLSQLTQPDHNLLLDSQEHLFNVFHVLQAEGSPYIPAQDEFVLPYGVRSVLGFGAPLPNGDYFPSSSSVKRVIPEATAHLFKPLAICAQIALAPHVAHDSVTTSLAPSPLSRPSQEAIRACHDCAAEERIVKLEKLLTVHEQTVNLQATRMEVVVDAADIGTWEWDIPSGQVTFNERWASMLGYRMEDIEPHVRSWEQLVHPDDKAAVMEAVSAHLRGETPQLFERTSLAKQERRMAMGF